MEAEVVLTVGSQCQSCIRGPAECEMMLLLGDRVGCQMWSVVAWSVNPMAQFRIGREVKRVFDLAAVRGCHDS